MKEKALKGNGQEKTNKINKVEVQPGFVFKCLSKEGSLGAKQLDAIHRKLNRAQELSSLVLLCFKEYNLQRNESIKEQGRSTTSKELDASCRSMRVSGAEREFLKTVYGLGTVKKSSRKASDKAMGTEAERAQIEKVLQNSQLVFS